MYYRCPRCKLISKMLFAGGIEEVEVLQSSGHDFLDQAAGQSVRRLQEGAKFSPEGTTAKRIELGDQHIRLLILNQRLYLLPPTRVIGLIRNRAIRAKQARELHAIRAQGR